MDDLAPDCSAGESFALMVLGHSMAPEFLEGEIIIIEPDGLAADGYLATMLAPYEVDRVDAPFANLTCGV